MEKSSVRKLRHTSFSTHPQDCPGRSKIPFLKCSHEKIISWKRLKNTSQGIFFLHKNRHVALKVYFSHSPQAPNVLLQVRKQSVFYCTSLLFNVCNRANQRFLYFNCFEAVLHLRSELQRGQIPPCIMQKPIQSEYSRQTGYVSPPSEQFWSYDYFLNF